jgi:hypothetical protein
VSKPRLPPPPGAPATAAGALPPPASTERSVYAAKRSPGRIALIVGAVVVLAAVAALVASSLGGSTAKHPDTATTSAKRHAETSRRARSHHRSTHAPKPSFNPAETSVTVLNATEAEGLAHRTATALQQGGYSLAVAQSGTPPGSGQVSVVEYAVGHQAEAEGVAQSLGISHVLPIEAGVSALGAGANVVVIVGQDRVSKSP